MHERVCACAARVHACELACARAVRELCVPMPVHVDAHMCMHMQVRKAAGWPSGAGQLPSPELATRTRVVRIAKVRPMV